MKTQLQKKLSACLPLLTWMIFSVSIANAQIIYTDVEPDLKVTQSVTGSNTYNLDLNKDGITDVILRANEPSKGRGAIGGAPTTPQPIFRRVLAATAAGSNLLMVKASSNSSTTLVPDGLALNRRVDSKSQVWDTTTAGQLMQSASNIGKWVDTTDRYLAIRIEVAGNWHYGWVRLSVAVASYNISFTVKDYAYNSIPNQSILAGETSCIAPTLNVTASGPLSFCHGESVQLNAVANSAYLFQWYRNNNLLSNATSNFYKAALSGTYQVNAVNSCGEVRSRVDTVMVFADPSVTVSGKTFTANAINATYQWIDCSTKQSISGATAKTFSPSIDGSYAVIIAENGCSDTSSCYTFCNAIDASVTVLETTLTANADSVTYQWIDCSTKQIISGATAKAFSPKISGTYAVIITVNGICKDTSLCYTICNTIDTSVTVAGNILTANANGATYQWINCFTRELVVGARAKGFSPMFSGTYAVIITVNGICKDTSSCYALTATAIGENNFAPAIRLYPNPARSQVTIDFEINNNRVDVQIFDLNGKMVYAKTTNSTQIEIDTKEFVEGVYVVRIQTENYLITKKLVIEK